MKINQFNAEGGRKYQFSFIYNNTVKSNIVTGCKQGYWDSIQSIATENQADN